VNLAISELNVQYPSYFWNITFYDTQSSSSGAATAMTQAVNDGCVYVVGASRSGSSLAAAPIATENRIPLISYASTSPLLTTFDDHNVSGDEGYLWRIPPSDGRQADAMADLAIQNGYATAAIVVVDSWVSVGNKLDIAFNPSVSQLLLSYNPGNFSANSIVSQIKTANPDVVFLLSFSNDGPVLIEEMANQVLNTPIISWEYSTSSTIFEDIPEIASAMENFTKTKLARFESPSVLAFNDAYETAYPGQNRGLGAEAYDATWVGALALLAANSTAGPDIISELSLTNFDGGSGHIEFDSNGDILDATYDIMKVKPILDNTIPVYGSTPGFLIYDEGTTGHVLVWNTTDENPDVYTLYRNGIEIDSGTWDNPSAIVINVDGLAKGIYNYTIVVYDQFANRNIDQAFVTVNDNTIPSFTFTQPDISITEGTTGNFVSWTATDLYPDTYIIYWDGTPVSSGSWSSGVSISFNIDGLVVFSIITFNYSILITDVSGNVATDWAYVTVFDSGPLNLNTFSNGAQAEETSTPQTIKWSQNDILKETSELNNGIDLFDSNINVNPAISSKTTNSVGNRLFINMVASGEFYKVAQWHNGLITYTPILVESNDDFDILGFPGSGTVSDPYTIEGKMISDESSVLIDIRDTTLYFTIRNNLLDGLSTSPAAISFTNVQNGNISDNTIKNNVNGISLYSSDFNTIDDNDVSDNTENGILLSDSHNNVISNNLIHHNIINGILVLDSHVNTIFSNEIYDNGMTGGGPLSLNLAFGPIKPNRPSGNGLRFDPSDGNIVTLNWIHDNLGCGLIIEFS
ncbi:MAG: ABC transporter substrate-binding protein, partial [Candidatus Kariarchaeaceae archaeon]